jgi:hypothetical protein
VKEIWRTPEFETHTEAEFMKQEKLIKHNHDKKQGTMAEITELPVTSRCFKVKSIFCSFHSLYVCRSQSEVFIPRYIYAAMHDVKKETQQEHTVAQQ